MTVATRLLPTAAFLATFLLLSADSSPGQVPLPGAPPEAKIDDPIEVQTRGPVHEAYAQPTDLQPEPGPMVPKQPPEPIPELPPEQQPEGENVQWIGGYWAWDADRNDFLWVSGIYRNGPPGRRYVAGYWTQTDEGWRWVSGFWASEQREEIPYVPEPPATLERGPSVPGPDENFYVPGSWVWRDERFVWRPGFWSPYQSGRVWTHAHYVWTPGGCVFVDGYWDYPLEERGLLFSPVVFHQPLWHTPGWYYRPRYLVTCDSLFDSLFFRPRHCHYYYGDWYGPRYAGLGFRPWFHGSFAFDPLYRYYRWHHRHDRDWDHGIRQAHLDRHEGRRAAPPRTFAQQTALLRDGNDRPGGRNHSRVATPLAQFKDQRVRLTPVSAPQLKEQQVNAERLRDLGFTRKTTEKAIASRERTAGNQFDGRKALKLPALPQNSITRNLPSKSPGNLLPGPGLNKLDRGKDRVGPSSGSANNLPRIEEKKPSAGARNLPRLPGTTDKVAPPSRPVEKARELGRPPIQESRPPVAANPPPPAIRPPAKESKPAPSAQPRVLPPRLDSPPSSPPPRSVTPPSPPRVERSAPAPRIESRPSPPQSRSVTPPSPPRVERSAPPPRIESRPSPPQPRSVTPPSPPRVERSAPPPRIENRPSPPQPRSFTPPSPPRIERSAPPPRVESRPSPPSQPRVLPPSSPPRVQRSAPPPAPRVNTQPRSNPPPQARSAPPAPRVSAPSSGSSRPSPGGNRGGGNSGGNRSGGNRGGKGR
jgi:hypothetical protein